MTFTITQGDSSPSLVSALGTTSSTVDLSNAQEIKFIMEDKYERVVINEGLQDSVNILDAANGKVEFIFDQSQTKTAGSYQAEWEVQFINGAIETFPTRSKIDIEIVEQIE